MKKIMFYCQYLTGMGHLVRSTEIVRQLVKEFQVCFINGGPTVPGFEIPPEAEIAALPPLWIEDGQLQVAEGFANIDKLKNARKNALIDLFDRFQPDCLITEFFPFGRHKLFFELIPLLEHIQAVSPDTKIVSSVRDIVGRTDLAQEEGIICQLTSKYFDLILFHSDPKFQKLAESFSRVRDLNCQIEYTGFVAQPIPENVVLSDFDLVNLKRSQPMILVSIGGGRIGYELLETAIAASAILAERIPHHIQIFTGPFMPEAQFLQLQQASVGKSNVTLERFTANLMTYMSHADLSISLTGYNTTMNIMRTGVRSLVVPIGHYENDKEQLVRTRKLEKMGIVEVVEPQNLEPTYLAQKIVDCLHQKPETTAKNQFDLQGAENTAVILQQLLMESAFATV
ncbi:MAG: glycosyl transferase [Pseudanabaena sp. RU_4_16]|nr:glycosyl transferase [Pseudanabaena sp. SU_2_4]NJM27912.1 glycosyl transferase [Pseudanabaena sp. RU_4_16]